MDIGQRHVGAVYPAGLFAALNFAQTQDIDEQAAFLKGWNQTYAQTSSGRFRGSIFEVQLAVVTDGDYRFAPDGPGDEPAPGKGVKQDVGQGSFLFKGPGQYQPPPSYFLIRGDPESRGSQMKPGFIDVITYGNPPVEIPPADGRTSGRRRALAQWLGSPDNPLTARVIVNRIWSHHFGRGIVATLDNFGKMGETPTHPELLDWLAVEFMDRGWSIKQMHRLIMTSEPTRWRRSSQDAATRRRTRRINTSGASAIQRLDAEIVRDAMMAASGALDLTIGGPPVFPQIAPEDPGVDAGRHLEDGRGRAASRGGAASTSIASAAWCSRCSRCSTCPTRTPAADAATSRRFRRRR